MARDLDKFRQVTRRFNIKQEVIKDRIAHKSLIISDREHLRNTKTLSREGFLQNKRAKVIASSNWQSITRYIVLIVFDGIYIAAISIQNTKKRK